MRFPVVFLVFPLDNSEKLLQNLTICFSILLLVFPVDISEQVSPQVMYTYLVPPLCVNTQL